ncbi:PSD1 and planctomycete cytochrome C domain-containing protein [Rubripirellula tenax]|nr:DUF1553 domain-containing protein [Rubripirellula tenax]
MIYVGSRIGFASAVMLLLVGFVTASEPLYQNTFDDPQQIEPLFQRFKSMKVVDGVLRLEHANGHAASPTLPVPFTDGVFRFRFKLAGADRLVCRFEDESRVVKAKAHLCRLEFRPGSASLHLNSPPKDRELRQDALFATHRQDFADDEWHSVEISFFGETLTATIDGDTKLEGRHEHLANEKLGAIFAVQKGVVLLDDLSLTLIGTEPQPEAVTAGDDLIGTRGLELFHDYIEPMFKQHCYECHSHEYEEASGGLVVDSRAAMLKGGDLGPSLVPGQPDESLLLEALVYENDAIQMPPDGKLDAQTLEYVREWIELDAPDPRNSISTDQPAPSGPDASKLWSVQPLAEMRPRGSIDDLISQKLEMKGLASSPDASFDVLVRRLHFVLTGLPPTIEEANSFVESAESDLDTAMERRVDELLSRRQFGERWGRHWLDIARYADASGTTSPRPYKQAWRYRDYVINAFNLDKSWSEFVRQQIAGDLIETDSAAKRAEGLVATGFLALSHVIAATRDPETLKLDTIDEQLDVVGKAFLGVAIGCARCHDHKLDPFPTRDYYSLAGVFRSSSSYQPSISQESLTLEGAELGITEADAVKVVAPWLRGGKGVKVHSVKEADSIRDEPIHLRGEVEITGEVVPRGFPTLVAAIDVPPIPEGSSGRRQLADWVLHENNALAWRVIVNRVWQHAFGQGIVRSTDNLGFTGDPPSHPELLDHLAWKFRDYHNGSFKSLIREMLLSRAWRQSSVLRRDAMDVDPENRLLWRANPRRMEAEAVIDSIQFVCDQLDLGQPDKTSVPGFKVGNQGSTADLKIPGVTLKRRSVYWPVFRKDVPNSMDVLGIFDFPPATAPRGSREVTRVPSQSLALLNNPFVIDNARALQKSLLSNASLADDRDRLRVLYQKLYSRLPTPKEEAGSLEFLTQFAAGLEITESAKPGAVHSVSWNRLCHALLVSNEFVVVP